MKIIFQCQEAFYNVVFIPKCLSISKVMKHVEQCELLNCTSYIFGVSLINMDSFFEIK